VDAREQFLQLAGLAGAHLQPAHCAQVHLLLLNHHSIDQRLHIKVAALVCTHLLGQVHQQAGFNHHIGRMFDQLNQRRLRKAVDPPAVQLHPQEGGMMDRNRRGPHHHRQPVPVDHQRGQQGEDAKVDLGGATRQVDVQPHL
jgi:hypothetical protein